MSRSIHVALAVGLGLAALAFVPSAAVADPPPLTAPGDMTVEATGPQGAVVSYTASSSESWVGVLCDPGPGSEFPLGATAVTCTAVDPGTGEQTTQSFSITVVDTTPPAFDPYPRRIIERFAGMDAHPVSYLQPTATDLVDGSVTVTCSPASGSKFSFGSSTVSCRAEDAAGNASTLAFAVLVLDKNPPPQVSDLAATPRALSVTVSWRIAKTPDVAGVELMRSPGLQGAKRSVLYRGRRSSYRDSHVAAGAHYIYTVNTLDPGGLRSGTVSVSARLPSPALFAPVADARVSSPPLLRWITNPHASYYNVQLYLNGTEVFSAWPAANQLQLPRRWTYAGHKYALGPGTYTWYVWPGLGPLAAARYGHLLGRSRFTVIATS